MRSGGSYPVNCDTLQQYRGKEGKKKKKKKRYNKIAVIRSSLSLQIFQKRNIFIFARICRSPVEFEVYITIVIRGNRFSVDGDIKFHPAFHRPTPSLPRIYTPSRVHFPACTHAWIVDARARACARVIQPCPRGIFIWRE